MHNSNVICMFRFRKEISGRRAKSVDFFFRESSTRK